MSSIDRSMMLSGSHARRIAAHSRRRTPVVFWPAARSDNLSTVDRIYEQVLDFIAAPSDDAFDAQALAVFRHQIENCGPYREYCLSRGVDERSVASWREIPPVPIQAFKWANLCCGQPQRIFYSTGTTQGVERRSRHAIPDLRLYRASAIAGMRLFLFPDVEQIEMVSLIPPVAVRPESSLAQMVAWAGEVFGGNAVVETVFDDKPSFDLLVDCLRSSENRGVPLAILTTTGALIHFLDYAAARGLCFRLPHGSRLMDTGGAKGAPRPMSRKGLIHAVWSTFAVPGYFVVNEYGMAELSSQLYESVIRDRYMGIHRPRHLASPPWARTLILDVRTLQPVEPGSPGLICHFDLANAGSAMAVVSEDLGVVDGSGMRLLGRAPRAEVRGCSLSAAEWHAH